MPFDEEPDRHAYSRVNVAEGDFGILLPAGAPARRLNAPTRSLLVPDGSSLLISRSASSFSHPAVDHDHSRHAEFACTSRTTREPATARVLSDLYAAAVSSLGPIVQGRRATPDEGAATSPQDQSTATRHPPDVVPRTTKLIVNSR